MGGFLGAAGGLANVLGFGAPLANAAGNIIQNQQNVAQHNANAQAFGKMIQGLGPEYEWARQWLQQAGPGAIPNIAAAMGGPKEIGEAFRQQALQPKIAEIMNDTTLSPEDKMARIAGLTGDVSLYEKLEEAKLKESWHPPPMDTAAMKSALQMLRQSDKTLPASVAASIDEATGPNGTPGQIRALYDKAFAPAYGSTAYGVHYLAVPGFDENMMPTVNFTPVSTRGGPPPAAVPAPTAPPPGAAPSAAAAPPPAAAPSPAAGLPPRVATIPPGAPAAAPTEEAPAEEETAAPTPEAAPSPGAVPIPSAAPSPAIGLGAGAGGAIPRLSAGGEETPGAPTATPTQMAAGRGMPRFGPGGIISGARPNQRETAAVSSAQNLLPQLKDLQTHMNIVGRERYDRTMIERGLGAEFAKYADVLPGTDPADAGGQAQINLYSDPKYQQLMADDRQLAFTVSELITVSAVAKSALMQSMNTRAYQSMKDSAGHIPEPSGNFNSIMTNIVTLGWKGGPYQTTLRQYGVPVLLGAPTGEFPTTKTGPIPGVTLSGPTGPPPPAPPGVNPRDYKPEWDAGVGQWKYKGKYWNPDAR